MNEGAAGDLILARGRLALSERTHVMGVVNVTPDSFSDGGRYLDEAAAIEHGLRLAEEGADILDVGGESTRPGAEPVDEQTEIARTAPVVEALVAKSGVPVSIDTSKSSVAQAAVDAGAQIVNDVAAGRFDERIFDVAASAEAGLVLMHMRGTPRTMQREPVYDDVVAEVASFLAERAHAAERAGVARERIALDPGFGFGKTLSHNLTLLRDLDRIVALGYPVLAGTSRKSFVGAALGGLEVTERMEGTAATVAIAILRGARIVRVHDVRAMVRVARMTDAVLAG